MKISFFIWLWEHICNYIIWNICLKSDRFLWIEILQHWGNDEGLFKFFKGMLALQNPAEWDILLSQMG